jgi:hypothetical protein
MNPAAGPPGTGRRLSSQSPLWQSRFYCWATLRPAPSGSGSAPERAGAEPALPRFLALVFIPVKNSGSPCLRASVVLRFGLSRQ